MEWWRVGSGPPSVHVRWFNNDFAPLLAGTGSVFPLNEVFLTVPLPNINYVEH